MQNAIDFRELRRRERERIRASNNKAKTNDANVGETASTNNDCCNLSGDGGDAVIGSCAQDKLPSAAYVTLLPKNKLSSEDIHRIGCSPTKIDSVFYAKDFLSPAQAREITSWLQLIPEYAQQQYGASSKRLTEREESLQHNGKWTRLQHAKRKVALFDGTLCNLPIILQRVSNTLVAVGAFPASHPPNHVLINEYQPGEGIMPHTDGPAYESRTATISVGGSDVIFKLWPRNQHSDVGNDGATQLQSTASSPQSEKEYQPALEVILHGNGSLVVFTGDAYLNYCHEISEGILEETTRENGICGNDIKGGTLVKRGYRISLTFRRKMSSEM